MAVDSVADIQRGRRDSTDADILTVYAKVTGLYAIYKTAERVVIHFADDPKMGSQQRQALAPLAPLLGEINGLVDGWRVSPKHKLKAKANIFDRRVADALLIALQGHAALALPLLQEIKSDLLEERTSPARVDYTAVAVGAALLLVLVACIMTWRMVAPIYNYGAEARSIWLGFGAGAVGALFSTCMKLRTRELSTDLQPWENRADAGARILIGSIAGALFVALLQSGLVTFSLGGEPIPGRPDHALSWVKLAVAGFIAGFSERLVSSVIDRATATAATRAGAQTLVGSGAAPTTTQGGLPSETNPLGRMPPTPPAPPAPPADPESAESRPDEQVDACVADVDIEEDEQTEDVELPPSVGGVAEAPDAR